MPMHSYHVAARGCLSRAAANGADIDLLIQQPVAGYLIGCTLTLIKTEAERRAEEAERRAANAEMKLQLAMEMIAARAA